LVPTIAPQSSMTRCALESRKEKFPLPWVWLPGERSILYSGAFGTRDSSGVPVAADSIFAIASMTKAITTVAALQLVEQGKVKLDEPVSQHLPQLANWKFSKASMRRPANRAASRQNSSDPEASAHAHIGILLRHLGPGHVPVHVENEGSGSGRPAV
jgi:hypothetical protein